MFNNIVKYLFNNHFKRLYSYSYSPFLSSSSFSTSSILNQKQNNNLHKMCQTLSQITNIEKSIYDPYNCPYLTSCANIMNLVTLNDLNLNNYQFNYPELGCMVINQNPNYLIAAFILPAGTKLPLHDHPDMTVLCKIITGKIRYNSFTYDQNEKYFHRTSNIKTLKDSTWIVSPQIGNFHELIADENTILLDTLVPPYDDPYDFDFGNLNNSKKLIRHCNYYEPRSIGSDKWMLDLLEYEPDNLPIGLDYTGLS